MIRSTSLVREHTSVLYRFTRPVPREGPGQESERNLISRSDLCSDAGETNTALRVFGFAAEPRTAARPVRPPCSIHARARARAAVTCGVSASLIHF